MAYSLYQMTFPNGKRYIGISNNPERRKAEHIKTARYGKQSRLCKAIRKYGIDDADFRVLCVGPKQYILDLEVAAIAAYGTQNIDIGYNIASGGEFGPMIGAMHTEETRKKMSESQKRRVRTPEELARMKTMALGKVFTEEYRKKLSDAAKLRKYSVETRAAISAGNRKSMAEKPRLGRHVSQETRSKISAKLKGVPTGNRFERTPEICAKTSAAKKGHVPSDRQRAALAAGRSCRWASRPEEF